MPYCSKNDLLFIHIPKNAGKSVEILFGMHRSHEGSPNSRSKLNEFAKWVLNRTANPLAEQTLLGVIDRSYTAQHLTLQEIELGSLLPHEILSRATIVAVIRDPYDRSYSLFNHWMQPKSSEKVESEYFDFLSSIPERRASPKHRIACHFRQQVDFLRDKTGSFERVQLIRFEHLQSDLTAFCKSHGLKDCDPNELTSRSDSDPAMRTAADSPRNRAMVESLFEEDYAQLGRRLNGSSVS